MKELINGPRKGQQEGHAIQDPETKELVVGSDEIKKVSLKHCLNVLEKNTPDEEWKDIVDIKSKVHDMRMETRDEINFEIKKDVFKAVMDKLEKKKKSSYDFLTKAGDRFKDAVFTLCRRMITEEEFPKRFEDTTLVQLYKGKGRKDGLQNSRYIHLKDWLPRTCDSMMVHRMKEVILSSSSVFQIGGQEGHRTQEHLFTVRSIVARETEVGRGLYFSCMTFKSSLTKRTLEM